LVTWDRESELYAEDGAMTLAKGFTDEKVMPEGVALVQFMGMGGIVL
jgi:hypothetical protein